MRDVPPGTHTISPRVDNPLSQRITVGERRASRIPYGRSRWSNWPDAYVISALAKLREDGDKRRIDGDLATLQKGEDAVGTTRWRAIGNTDLRIAS
jgi:hypothetical protein